MKPSYYSPPEKRLKGGGFESENPRGSSGPSGIPRDFAARLVVEVYALSGPAAQGDRNHVKRMLIVERGDYAARKRELLRKAIANPTFDVKGRSGDSAAWPIWATREVGFGPSEALVAGHSIRIPL